MGNGKSKTDFKRSYFKKIDESRKELIERFLKKGLISKETDGFYYQKPIEINIKTLTKNRLEFGNEKVYLIHERIK